MRLIFLEYFLPAIVGKFENFANQFAYLGGIHYKIKRAGYPMGF